MFVSDSVDFIRRFKPVAGKPLRFTAPGLVHGADGPATEFVPRDALIPNFAVGGFLFGTVLLYLVGVDVFANQVEYRWAGEAVLTTPRVALWTGLGVTWEVPR